MNINTLSRSFPDVLIIFGNVTALSNRNNVLTTAVGRLGASVILPIDSVYGIGCVYVRVDMLINNLKVGSELEH